MYWKTTISSYTYKYISVVQIAREETRAGWFLRFAEGSGSSSRWFETKLEHFFTSEGLALIFVALLSFHHCANVNVHMKLLKEVSMEHSVPFDRGPEEMILTPGTHWMREQGVCVASLQAAPPPQHHSPTVFLHNFPFDNHIIFHQKCHLYLVWPLGKLTQSYMVIISAKWLNKRTEHFLLALCSSF